METINHNNLPEAVALLIQEIGGLKSMLQAKQSPEVVEFDRITNIDEVSKIIGYGKSKIYKLTWKKEIPFKLMGNRLVFSRKELLTWLESQTVNPVSNKSNVLNAIAESASKKS
ncbi:MAG: helix-turn-helix domain-containing protein [Bacteroidota bacterium]